MCRRCKSLRHIKQKNMSRFLSFIMICMLFVGSVSASDNLYDSYYGRPSYFPDFVVTSSYPNNMSYKVAVVDAQGKPITNYEVSVYDQNNELRAIGRSYVQNGDYCKLLIWGVEGDTFRFEVLYGDIVRPTVMKISETCQFKTNATVGSTSSPFTLTIDESGKAANVCYTLSNVPAGSFRTICLPYEVDCSNGTAYEVSGVDTDLLLSPVSTMEAGKPYFIKASATGDVDFLFHNIARGATTKVSAPVATGNNGLVGTFVDNGNVPQGMYILSSNQLYRVDRDLAFKANRAYLDLSQVTNTQSEAKAVRLGFVEERETSISQTDSEAITSVLVYPLDGKLQRGMQKGVNLVRMNNGTVRKVLVK